MFIITAYDITDDSRRNKLRKCLKGYGMRVQYSIFIGDLKKPEIKSMKKDVRRIVDRKKDSVHYYLLCDECRNKIEDLNGIRDDSLPFGILV